MRRIAEVDSQDLRWSQPSAWKFAYELTSSDEPVGTLRFRSSWGTLAEAESGDGRWTFKRVGFWQSRASLRSAETEEDLGFFQNNTWTSGGTLSFKDGREFRATTNLWNLNLRFEDSNGTPLVCFDHSGVFHHSAKVEICPEAKDFPETPLLVFFGWYLLVMLALDASGSASVASTT